MNPATRAPGETALPSKGGWRALPVVVAGCMWLGFVVIAFSPSLRSVVQARVPWMIEPLFHDLHVIRLGWQAKLAGVDALADPGSPFNYPRLVLVAADFGALRIPAEFLGLLEGAVLLGALLAVLRSRTVTSSVVAAGLLLCPPVWLLLERGNLDAIAVVLVAASCFVLSQTDSFSPVLRAAAIIGIFAAAMLKLYPAAVLVAGTIFWRDARRWAFAVATVAFAWWAAWHANEIALVTAKTTRGLEGAYGMALAGSRYCIERVAPTSSAADARQWLATAMRASAITYLVGTGVAAVLGWCGRKRVEWTRAYPFDAFLFVAGAVIYSSTFALGSNWSYRLVFLLFCAPLLVKALNRSTDRIWTIAVGVGTVVLLFAPFKTPLFWFMAIQGVAWLTAWLLVAAGAALATAPAR